MRKAIILPAIFLAACSNYPSSLPSIKPYSMDIQQGNVVTSKMMMQLRPGMTKAQVRYVMGTPLIADSFHANRWDYLYRMQKAGKVIEQRRVILDFEDDKLTHVRGDVVPAGSSAAAPLSDDKSGSKEPITLKPANGTPPKKEDKGLLDKLKFWNSDDEKAPAKAQQPAAEEKLQALPPLMEAPAAKPAAPVQAVTPEPEAKPAQPPAAPQLPDIADKKPEPLPPLMEAPAAEAVPVKPEAKPATPKAPASTSKAESAPVAKSAAKPAPAPESKAEPKPAPKPQEDLPAEGDPSYFERMLEKIGF